MTDSLKEIKIERNGLWVIAKSNHIYGDGKAHEGFVKAQNVEANIMYEMLQELKKIREILDDIETNTDRRKVRLSP